MKKILLISLQKYGGGAIDSLSLSNALCSNKFFHYLAISKYNELENKFVDNKFRKIFKIETFKSSILSFIFQTFVFLKFFKLILILFKIKPDIIFITHPHLWSIFIFVFKKILKYKILYGLHDNPFNSKEKYNILMNFLNKIFLNYADNIIVYSKFMMDSIKKYLPFKNILVLPLGIYKDLFPNFKKYFNLNKKYLTILFLGRILPYKGIDVLIEAFEILKSKNIKFEATIAGKGNLDKNNLKKIKQFNIQFKNYWLSNKELLELLEKTDILIMPYKKATQSGIISIALAYGIPVVATKVGSFGEYIEDGISGFLIEPNNKYDLAQKIEQIYLNRNILLEIQKNIFKINKKFYWENSVKNLINLIKK